MGGMECNKCGISVELQQRSYELQSLATSPGEMQQVWGNGSVGGVKCHDLLLFPPSSQSSPPSLSSLQAVLPHDGSCEDIDEAEMAQIRTLGFLDW